ncbi:UDP-N-acetyl glucosamine 2-epimerase [Microvirga sp. G4-2]|uniref:UDP-N-acetyl glucosamine 2-epimerase n=1 Tax=Microvirga sp. G4-2 TaxID=3434467 RepID=UPI0040446475
MKKIITVVGNRPQFVKAAIVAKQWAQAGIDKQLSNCLVHTGQHYDQQLSDIFFHQLGLPSPDYNLKIGSGPIIDQIGAMLPLLREIFEEQRPDGVLVYGDTNSTIAAALAAAHLHIPLFHVEAGERNFRRFRAPEEVNRIVTDELAWLCLTSTEKAQQYLLREGFAAERVVWAGDPMYDLFCWAQSQLKHVETISIKDLGLAPEEYALATLHRAENTTEKSRLLDLLSALDRAPLPVLLPIHPRVRNLLSQWEWQPSGSLKIIDPLSYFDILTVLLDCRVCITDSGGLAREAFFAGKPGIIPLPNSGWNEIVEAGWAKVIPGSGEELLQAITDFKPSGARPDGLFGNGRASERIGWEILRYLDRPREEGAWHPLGDFFAIPQPEDRSKFTYSALRNGLGQLADNGIRIVPLGSGEPGPNELAIVYLVSSNLSAAANLAEIHAEAGQSVTFILRVDSSIYNILSGEVQAFLRKIAAQKHQIGLCYDEEAWGAQEDDARFAAVMSMLLNGTVRWVYRDQRLITIGKDGAEVAGIDEITSLGPNEVLWENFPSAELLPRAVLVDADPWSEAPISLFELKQRKVVSQRQTMERELGLVHRSG